MKKAIRSIDKMGRIVIPNDIRKATGLQTGDEVSIEISGTGILLNPVTKHCAFCSSKYELVSYCDKYICQNCIKAMKMI